VFYDDDEVQEEVMKSFKGQAVDFYDSGIQKLVPRLNKCLDNFYAYGNTAVNLDPLPWSRVCLTEPALFE